MLEKVDIQDVMFDVAEGKLQVVNIPQKKISWIENQVKSLELNNGDLDRFLGTATETNLFYIEIELALPENVELAKRWNKAIAINKKIRMRLITNKALRVLEEYENKSATSSTADISFARAVLFMCNTDREKEVIRKPTDTEDEYEDVEKTMERD